MGVCKGIRANRCYFCQIYGARVNSRSRQTYRSPYGLGRCQNRIDAYGFFFNNRGRPCCPIRRDRTMQEGVFDLCEPGFGNNYC